MNARKLREARRFAARGVDVLKFAKLPLAQWAVLDSLPAISVVYGWPTTDDLMVCASLILDGEPAK